MYRYYLTQRSPSPGCQPRGFKDCEDYGIKKFIVEIGYSAWGYVEYKNPLTKEQISEYELIEG